MACTAYTIQWTTLYSGTAGHPTDQGYRAVRAQHGNRQFLFYCDPDGSNVSRVETRWRNPDSDNDFRRLSAVNSAKRAPKLERAIKAYLATHSEA